MKLRYFFPLLLLTISNACALLMPELKTPQISLVSITPLKFGLFEQSVQLRLRINNPNGISLPINGLQYRLQLNQQEFAKGSSNDNITIPANGEALVNLNVNTSLNAIMQQLQQFQRQIPDKVAYKLDGSVGLSSYALALPFAYEGDVDILSLLRRQH